jgi:hypothetical protein
MYTGLAASESVKVSPEASARVKSGASGPSGFTLGASGATVDDDGPGSIEPGVEAPVVAVF